MMTISLYRHATWLAYFPSCSPQHLRKSGDTHLTLLNINWRVTVWGHSVLLHFPPLPPLGHIWDVMLVWRKGNLNKNCLCVTVVCTVIMVHKDMSSSYRLVDCISLILLGLALFQAPLCLQSSWCYILRGLHGVTYWSPNPPKPTQFFPSPAPTPGILGKFFPNPPKPAQDFPQTNPTPQFLKPTPHPPNPVTYSFQ